MASIDELVRTSGYSRSTVFRFLAGKSVRPAARAAILEAARETDYMIGKAAQRDAAILLSVPPGFEGFRGFADAVEGVMRRGRDTGVPVIFDEAHAAARRLGVIILGKGMREEDAERRERTAAGIPCVLVNRIVDEADASWVSADFRAAAADATRRLIRAGCRRIACWADTENRRVDLHKVEGLRRTAEEASLAVSILSPADGDLETAADAAFSGVERPDGWLAPSDEIAMRVIRAAAEAGLRVPGDLSVIGMNDVEGAAYFSPALTSVHVPFHACGAAAVDAVLRLLDRPIERSVRILIRHHLVERESCAPVVHAE